jgi:hypothetical protein
MAKWKWTRKRHKVCALLAAGKTIREASEEAGITERTIYRWKNDPTFFKALNDLTLTTGIAMRAERLRIAKRLIAQIGSVSEKDLLDWLKYAATETDGLRLGIADELAELLAGASSGSKPMAGEGPGRSGDDAEEEAEDAG